MHSNRHTVDIKVTVKVYENLRSFRLDEVGFAKEREDRSIWLFYELLSQ